MVIKLNALARCTIIKQTLIIKKDQQGRNGAFKRQLYRQLHNRTRTKYMLHILHSSSNSFCGDAHAQYTRYIRLLFLEDEEEENHSEHCAAVPIVE